MSYEQAVEKAGEFLNSQGMGDFRETYYFTDEGVCVVNFAAMQKNTILKF